MVYKGSVDRMPTFGAKGAAAEPNPPRDYEVDGVGTLTLGGAGLRYTSDLPVWNPMGRSLYRQQFESTFDGRLERSLRIPAFGEEPYPMAIVKTAARSGAADLFHLLPLTVTVRGHHDQFFRGLPRFTVTGRTVPVNGRPCLELVADSRTYDRREILLLDAERGYVVVRKTTLVGGKPTWQVDVSYDPDPLVGWLPQAWEYMIRVGGKPYQGGRWAVAGYALNEPDGGYDVTYPPGTRVIDTSGETEVQYAIRDDGVKGKEIPTASIPTYEELLQPPPPRSYRWGVVAVAIALLLLGVGAVVWVRHRRRARTAAARQA
jgi:hypothetical protein